VNNADDLIRDARYAGLVYLKTGPFSGIASVLVRTEEELILWAGGEERFRVPLSEVERVEFPWWFGGMRVVVAGNRYTLGFSPPAKTEGELPGAFEDRDEELRAYLPDMDNPVASLRLGAAALSSRREWKAALADLRGD
jgi:hypothetical protein